MTMKPKARKFRIRRSAPQKGAAFEGGDGRAPRDEARERAHEDQQPAQTRAPDQEREQERFQGRERPAATGTEIAQASAGERPRTHEGQVSTSREMAASQDISQIRREGLTGRQLRMARRIAQKHGLAPTSDFDAVRLLRARGIDPFQRSSMLELVSSDDGGSEQTENHDRVQLPQTVQAATTQLPSTEVSPAERRSEEIMRIQRDIGRRRRRKLALLFARLAAFVFLPTLVAGYYYYVAATPMYSTKSEFLILVADGGGGAGGGKLGGLLPSQFATGRDAIATQSYLTSKDAMLRLNRDEGFRAHFSQPWIDPIQRLDPDASTEDVYSLYKKYVKLGYDPTEGVLRMEVSTADPEVSRRFSEKLIEYAEERVDQLSQRKREDAVKTAVASLEEAKEARREAQRQLVELQEKSVLDPE